MQIADLGDVQAGVEGHLQGHPVHQRIKKEKQPALLRVFGVALTDAGLDERLAGGAVSAVGVTDGLCGLLVELGKGPHLGEELEADLLLGP